MINCNWPSCCSKFQVRFSLGQLSPHKLVEFREEHCPSRSSRSRGFLELCRGKPAPAVLAFPARISNFSENSNINYFVIIKIRYIINLFINQVNWKEFIFIMLNLMRQQKCTPLHSRLQSFNLCLNNRNL